MSTAKIPVTILTGFLGAGKTTLLNRILSEYHGQHLAVVVNEFGEIGIDQELIVRTDEAIVEMNNGCLCCTVRGDLNRHLMNLLQQRERFAHVLVETTGLANPGPVALTFLWDQKVRQAFTLDGIVTVVDARHIVRHLEECEEARAQIVFADVLIFNKLDLIEEAAVAPLEQRLRRINALAQVYRSTHTAVPIAPLLRLGGFDIERARLVNPTLLPAETLQSWEALAEHSHNDDIRSVSLEMEGALHPLLVRAWLSILLLEHGVDLFRAKGILHLADRDERFIFQSVHMLFDCISGRPWGTDRRVNRLVFIGRHLDRQMLESGLSACLQQP